MKKIFLVTGCLVVVAFILLQSLSSVMVSAQGGNSPTNPGGNIPAAPSGPCKPVEICNPLKVDSIQELIAEALQFVVNLLAVAGVVYIIWTGFMFVKAQGNPEELKVAKKSFLNAIIGMAIILGAWAIATVIANTINEITGNEDAVIGIQ